MSATLVLAVPAKGRLEENARAFFARAGMAIARGGGERDYRGRIEGVADAEVAFLSSAEIARELAAGGVHLGVTGEDLVRETVPNAAATIEMVAPLGFGHADVVVAVPRAWIDVATMADLDDVAHGFRARHGRRLRVATKYVNLTRRHFAAHGVADYRVVESLGATEGAPAAGSAELIVDITTTGATLAANDLKVLDDGVILRSEANLMASLAAAWPKPVRAALDHVLDRVAAEARARAIKEVRADMPPEATFDLDAIKAIGPGIAVMRRRDGREGTLLVLHVPHGLLYAAVRALKAGGARRVTAAALDYVFDGQNPLKERLAARLPR
jgi:ATP phosphoribosyltransferase